MIKKSKIVFLIIAGIMVLTAVGCQMTATNEQVPPLDKNTSAKIDEVSYEDFMAKKNITRDIEIVYPASVVVKLASNPSTGFQWSEAEIGNTSVLSLYEHDSVPAQSAPQVGSSGMEVWTFKPLQTGTSTIKLNYSRPWEGGEKNEWTYTLNVAVK